MAQPDGFARFGADVRTKKRAKRQESRKLGRTRYAVRFGLRMSIWMVPLLYTLLVMMPLSEKMLPDVGRSPRVLTSFLLVTLGTLFATVVMGVRVWNRAEQGWAEYTP